MAPSSTRIRSFISCCILKKLYLNLKHRESFSSYAKSTMQTTYINCNCLHHLSRSSLEHAIHHTLIFFFFQRLAFIVLFLTFCQSNHNLRQPFFINIQTSRNNGKSRLGRSTFKFTKFFFLSATTYGPDELNDCCTNRKNIQLYAYSLPTTLHGKRNKTYQPNLLFP